LRYGQFCPIAKAAEVIGERWTLLVVRELLSGATSFSELQRGLGQISPSVLSSRIKTLVDVGIIELLPSGAGAARGYRLTQAGAELAPTIESIGIWGRRWVRSRMNRDELDVELLMLHIQRSFDAGAFPQQDAVVAFVFQDLHGAARRWWLLIARGEAELCAVALGRSADITLSCRLRTLAEVFNGDLTLAEALDSGRLAADGSPKLARSLPRWLRLSPFAATPLP
jgi:DNA-binding HxlR family transcriptional regulator